MSGQNKEIEDNTNDNNSTVTKPPQLSIPIVNVIEDIEDNGDVDGTSVSERDELESPRDDGPYHKFSPNSYRRLVERETEAKRKSDEKKNKLDEGRLVDGELKFGDEDETAEDDKKDKDFRLIEGNNLPEDFPEVPKNLYGVPIEEIDPYIKEKSFVVLARKFRKLQIFRFSPTRSLFLFAPWNTVRRISLYISTNQFFDYLIILTILVNCVLLIPDEATNPWVKIAEYVFLAIYSLECIIKVTSRGFIFYPYTYLRDGWNWLDFFVVLSSYVTIIIEYTSSTSIGNISGLRTFRVLRALKTITIIPGLKTIIQALLKSLKVLIDVIILLGFCMMVFSMFALQVYSGILRNKCVAEIPSGTYMDDYVYSIYVKNSSNWYISATDDDYTICGNASNAGTCPSGYSCLPDLGDNPRHGYTNFDDMGWAMLNSFQLITLDFWEDNYNKVIRANGPWNIIFFVMVVFFGSYYLINLMLAVVSMSYEEEAINAGKEKEEEKKSKKRKNQQLENSNYKTKDKDKAGKDNDKDKNDKSKTANSNEKSTHLKVMSAVNGGSTTLTSSSASLKSVGNGVIRNNNPATILKGMEKPTPKDDAKKPVDTKVEKLPPKQHPETNKLGAMADTTIAQWDKPTEGYVNPLMKMSAEDNLSNDSESNNGDAPRVIIREDDDDELVDRNVEICARCCKCYIPLLVAQNKIYRIVSDLIFELAISLCIGINVVVMAMAYYPMTTSYEKGLEYVNYVFTGIFTLEAIIKIFAMSKDYFKSAWNIFDLIIVLVSYIDIGLTDIDGLSVFRALKLLRLMRIFKLAQTWSTMRRILLIIMSTLGAVGNIIIVLVIIIYIFAVIGMQLFRNTYTSEIFGEDIPRWNFDDFPHALFLVFRILCGEWIEMLWECMRANGQLCMVVFLPSLIIGNFMVLNLFLALLLNAFASDSMNDDKTDKESSKMKQGWRKLKGLFKSRKTAPGEQKLTIADLVKEMKLKQKAEKDAQGQKTDTTDGEGLKVGDIINGESVKEPQQGQEGNGFTKDGKQKTNVSLNKSIEVEILEGYNKDGGDIKQNGEVNKDKSTDAQKANGGLKNGTSKAVTAFKTDRSKFATFGKDVNKGNSKEKEAEKPDETESNKEPEEKPKIKLEEDKAVDDDEEIPGNVVECWPLCCYERCCTFLNNDSKSMERWMTFRRGMHRITEHKAFEYFILVIIFASSVSLCFEDIYLYRHPTRVAILDALNLFYLLVFGIEMLMKWISLGFKKYFTNFWTILDFCIVMISIVSQAAESTEAGAQIGVFRGLRTLRAFRPLKAISRWPQMKIVVNALVSSIPAISNVAVVILVFWLLFSIAGVQLFSGKFYKCVDENEEKISRSIVLNKTQCFEGIANGSNWRWKNSKIHFDNVAMGYVALLQVATFEGWIEIMEDATDSVDIDQQPGDEKGFWYYLYFIAFIIVGSFFTLNLFIGVIIDNFNTLKKKYEGGFVDVFLTSSQKNYYTTMKKLGVKKPQKTIKRPKNAFQGFFFDVSMSTKFELAIIVLIILNMIAMAFEHYGQPESYDDALDLLNIVFTTIFTLEALVKIMGLRWHYFRRAWNIYDFIICIVSIIGVVIDDLLRTVFITPTLLRVIRVFRIGRVLRLVKAAKGLRKLLFALVISLPALLNIGMLLFLLIFIYAIFGMSMFGTVKITGALDDVVNFQTFGNSMILLFRLTTAGGWNDILDPLMINEDDGCNSVNMTMPDGEIVAVTGGDCGNSGLAIFFMMTFVIITSLVMINMYIAVILENYSQAHEQEEVGITEDDFEMFYVTWERYDPHATQFIKYDQLSDFVGDLDEPLGMPKPNEIALVAFDLPIYNGDRLHCLDILTALVKHVLGGVEETEEFNELRAQMDEKYKESFPTRMQQQVVATTMRRKKEDVAAKTLQRAWRQHRAQENIRNITKMAMQDKKRQGTRTMSFFTNDPGGGMLKPNTEASSGTANGGGKSSPRRPDSPSATKNIKAADTAQEKKKTTMGSKLQIPKATDIRLPSENYS